MTLGSMEGMGAATYAVDAGEVLMRFTIPGNPRPKERPRQGKGRTYTPAGTVIAEQSVLAAFDAAYPNWEPVAKVIKLDLKASFYRDSHRLVDVDNLAKLIQDALNKRAFVDDSQVFDLHGHKWFTTKDRARTEVVITRVDSDRIEAA
ncbi:RusA family crossover junction endodeoxyribonuclease [Cryobacterium melibiosiphilum]|uniref:RusA family crossover junction endodeoxyribonuclease n=1 Tax=Cryobacterium melibiosiphilum TaxID=995039 RepID=A0A3A5MGU0_9MICO|nr:RusA family crossover junction endodeoxyribonuclease [Cryobacterium melibiosiphilum]RJT88071.1 RusA family crossover junction endodeoxyribonuclease [Cryobacterium melibiosiphilum]